MSRCHSPASLSIHQAYATPGFVLFCFDLLCLAADEHSVRAPTIPRLVSSFCGRQEIIDDIVKEIYSTTSHPVISIVGPPGFGKTSIAVAVSHRIVAEETLQVCFVPLRGTQDAGQMVSQVIKALSPVAATGHGESRTLSEVVKSVETKTLLVLDNAEDCIDKTLSEQGPSTSFNNAVKEIIDSNRKVKLLLTSRVRFQSIMPSVCEFVIQGLDESNSTILLKNRCPNINPDEAREIVRWCGGVPLAIYIAAGMITFDGLSTTELLQEFRENGLEAIQPGGDWLNVEEHLVAMISSAVDRLLKPLQLAFFGLSLFSGTFKAEAGAAVVGTRTTVQLKKDYTTHLRRRCLLEYDLSTDRFSMQPLLSEFGRRRCRDKDKQALQSRFSRYFLQLFKGRLEEPTRTRTDVFQLIRFVLSEYHHLSSALVYSVDLDQDQETSQLLKFFATSPMSLLCFASEVQLTFYQSCCRVAEHTSDLTWLCSSLLGQAHVFVYRHMHDEGLQSAYPLATSVKSRLESGCTGSRDTEQRLELLLFGFTLERFCKEGLSGLKPADQGTESSSFKNIARLIHLKPAGISRTLLEFFLMAAAATLGQEEPVHFEPVETLLEWVDDLLSPRPNIHTQVLRDGLSAFLTFLHVAVNQILERNHVWSSTLLKLRLAEKSRALRHRLKDSYLFHNLMSSTFRSDHAQLQNAVVGMALVQPLKVHGISNWAIFFLLFLNDALRDRHILRAIFPQHQQPTRSPATKPSNLVVEISRLPPLHRIRLGHECMVCI